MPRAFLQVLSGARQGLHVPLHTNSPFVIGRVQGDLRLNDPLVSGQHCRIACIDDHYTLTDLGSTNGTRVNGRTTRTATLVPGTEITIGANQLVFYLVEEPRLMPESSNESQLDIAWLLDEELVEPRTNSERTPTSPQVVNQELRLPPGLTASVSVVAGRDVGKVFSMPRGSACIGRGQGEIPLSDVEVSRRHSVIELFGHTMLFVRDLGSTNGTYHNGHRVRVGQLQSGDTIGCGKTIMKFLIDAS